MILVFISEVHVTPLSLVSLWQLALVIWRWCSTCRRKFSVSLSDAFDVGLGGTGAGDCKMSEDLSET